MQAHAPEHLSVQHCVDAGIVWHPPIGESVRIRADLDGRCPEGAHDGAEPGHTGVVVNTVSTGLRTV